MPVTYGYPLGEPFRLVFLFTSSIEYNAVDVDDQDKNHPMTTLIMMDYIQYPHISGHDKIDPIHVMAWVYQHREPFFPGSICYAGDGKYRKKTKRISYHGRMSETEHRGGYRNLTRKQPC